MNKLWFKRKRYGWGWTPSTIEGWFVTLIYVITIFIIFLLTDKNSHSASDTLFGVSIPFLISTILFILIAYLKGENPKWQWGEHIDKK